MDVGAPENTPLVSVIVPIYNVEPWLRKCLESLKGQTLKQIEVIMVEDGSTDESREIAEEYKNDEWPRFRIIHHGVNRGLSAARNTGIDAAKAAYLMFVDSDDWVDEKFCEIPYTTAIENQAEIVMFQACPFKKKYLKHQKNPGQILCKEVNAEEAIDYDGIAVWNKIYKKGLFKEVRYPEGLVYEDIATTFKLIYKSRKIIECKGYPLLYHTCRAHSISNGRFIENKKDCLIACLSRYEEITKLGYPKHKAKQQIESAAISLCVHMKPDRDSLYLKASDIVNGISGIPRYISKKQQLALYAWKINEHFFHFICRLLGKKYG